jgi:CheY-like chemotaxis protein
MPQFLPRDKKPLILVAEDDSEDRFIMMETFNELGHADAIYIVEDGLAILQYLQEEGAGTIAMIILDLNMPKLNGTEILRKLQGDERYTHIYVVIFSTSVNQIEKENCIKLGAKEYVTKPSKYAEYMATCRKFYEIAKDMSGKNSLPSNN